VSAIRGSSARSADPFARAVHALALGALGALGALAAPQAGAAQTTSPAASSVPAMWQTYDLIVNLDHLPRTYTCDDLWYEFRGIVLRLGAPGATLVITPYECSPSPQGTLTSPRVEIRFQLPAPVLPQLAGLARLRAVSRTVRIAPGEPKTLKPSDCELLKQIEETLLASLPVHVVESRLDCGVPGRHARHFGVTVRLLAAEPGSGKRAG
jgi:hypothetical protein